MSPTSMPSLPRITVPSLNGLRAHLFRKSSFWDGFWYFFGLAPNPYEETTDYILNRSAAEALAEDWRAVGRDLYVAFKKHEHLLHEQEQPNQPQAGSTEPSGGAG